MITLDIKLRDSYPIIIGERMLDTEINRVAQIAPNKRVAVVSDENVWSIHGKTLQPALERAGLSFTAIVVKPGENSKSQEVLGQLYERFYEFSIQRNDPVIAFGGGVVGDLAGYAAATYMRGVPLVQIPTTLLAQVDSSVGGKVAVNLPEGKNLIGCFYQPAMVLCDTKLLNTLSARDFASGMAEVIKYAAIGNMELLSLLEAGQYDMQRVIFLCCKSKAGFVERDERDYGERMMLNFGHTFGHAIEKASGYGTYTHGEAVSIGMVMAARLGESIGFTEQGTANRLSALLESAQLPTELDAPLDSVLSAMAGDKKNAGNQVRLVMIKRMGEPVLHQMLLDEISRYLHNV